MGATHCLRLQGGGGGGIVGPVFVAFKALLVGRVRGDMSGQGAAGKGGGGGRARSGAGTSPHGTVSSSACLYTLFCGSLFIAVCC